MNRQIRPEHVADIPHPCGDDGHLTGECLIEFEGGTVAPEAGILVAHHHDVQGIYEQRDLVPVQDAQIDNAGMVVAHGDPITRSGEGQIK